MQVSFVYAERIKLSHCALEKISTSFFSLKHDVVVTFDKRLSDYGRYYFKDNLHDIRIGLRNVDHLNEACQKHEIINTLLHELYHAYQYEQVGPQRWESKSYTSVKGVQHKRINYQYCQQEVEARSFADSVHLKAVAYYERLTSKI